MSPPWRKAGGWTEGLSRGISGGKAERVSTEVERGRRHGGRNRGVEEHSTGLRLFSTDTRVVLWRRRMRDCSLEKVACFFCLRHVLQNCGKHLFSPNADSAPSTNVYHRVLINLGFAIDAVFCHFSSCLIEVNVKSVI